MASDLRYLDGPTMFLSGQAGRVKKMCGIASLSSPGPHTFSILVGRMMTKTRKAPLVDPGRSEGPT